MFSKQAWETFAGSSLPKRFESLVLIVSSRTERHRRPQIVALRVVSNDFESDRCMHMLRKEGNAEPSKHRDVQ